ncbi:TonB-dependent receptor [Phenylobacterium sp.]|jgi:outer membrane receptor protein involved in Fe transport|uniref:TonB-dependent receptor n=1 Tax=Phenylobacterium sp. TaxID=1871053 RepID=UPI0037CAF3DE
MRKTYQMKALLVAGASALALAGVASSAFAAEDVATIEELVVTAQKRAESIQDVPIAVSAFSQDALQKSRIDGGPNLVLAIPNVNFSKGNFTGYNFQIRGIGSKLVAGSGDAGTGIHLNNAPLISNNLFETEFYDVERVEVLRGPQGTLYGRNATGGVVNLISNKPSDRLEGMARGEYGNYNSIKLRGMINAPIGDALAVRLAGTYLKRDGFGTNTFTGNDADTRDMYGYRASAKFQPVDNFKAIVVYDKFHEDDSRSRIGKQFCSKDVGPTNVGGVAFSAVPAIGQVQRGLFSQGCRATALDASDVFGTVNSQATLGGLFGALGGFQTGDAYAGKMQSKDVRDIESSFDPIYRADTDIVQLHLEWDVTENLQLTSLTNQARTRLYTRQDYNRYTPSVNFNTTPNPVNALAAVGPAYPNAIYPSLFPNGVVKDPQNGDYNRFTTSDISASSNKQFNQELRLQSSFDGPWNFSVGALYLDFSAEGDYYVMFNTGTAWYQVNNLLNTGNANCASAAPCVAIDPNKDPDRSGHNYFDNFAPYSLISTAVFGEVYWEMMDGFKWTAGLRWTKDEKEQKNYAVTLGAPGVGLIGPPAGTPPVLAVDFEEMTGRFGFDWKPELSFTNQSLIYAFYSRGYKAGGLNPACSQNCTGLNATFEPEFINAYEIGAKNTLLDGTLQLNGTFFMYDYTGYQVSKIVNRTSINENIDAKVKGIEVESIWNPIQPLRFNASVGWLESEITGGTSIDTFNRTQDDPNLVVVKSSAAANCVVSKTTAATALSISNSQNNPFALLGVCSGAFGAASDGVSVNLNGKELPNAPHFTVSLGAQYTFEMDNGWAAVARADYYHQTESFARIYNSVPDQIEAWSNVNLTLSFANADNGWSVDGFVKNATDEEAITDTYLTDDSSGLFRNAFYTEPRTFGVAVSKSW